LNRPLPFAVCAVLTILAAHPSAAQVEAGRAWARATPPGARTGVVYLTVENRNAAPDRLVRAETPVAERAELHTHDMEAGVARMRPLAGVEMAPGQTTVLAPGGLHVMLVGLHRQLKRGEAFALTLVFERAEPVTLEVRVEGPGAGGPSQGHHHGH